jgi:Spy/CpxP family protein refolding chaperone
MRNAKQQALMFLLGAFVTGGALGAAVDRTVARPAPVRYASAAEERKAMRDDVARQLDLTAAQRAMMDSILDERNRQQRALLAPLDGAMDSLRTVARQAIVAQLTPEQRERFARLTAQIDARRRADTSSKQ